MEASSEHLWTVARIAEHLAVNRHRVEYVIDSRKIAPQDRAGIARVFHRRDVDLIAREIERMDQFREGVSLEH